MANKSVVLLMGPTASGKTDLALELAQFLPVEIISVDSAMIYRGMDIGTAKPSVEVRAQVPHHLIDICDPAQPYSVGRFLQDASMLVNQIMARGRLPLLVGGTSMYCHALANGIAQLPTADPEIRDQIVRQAQSVGWPAMHAKLCAIDPVSASKIEMQDKQRIQRALEVYQLSGKPISWHWQQGQSGLDQHIIALALAPGERIILHNRIEQRFANLLASGFVEEVSRLKKRDDLSLDSPALRAVGYRQIWQYLNGEFDVTTMHERALAATRQLAKRQLTWLRRWPDLHWLDLDYKTQEVAAYIEQRLTDQEL